MFIWSRGLDLNQRPPSYENIPLMTRLFHLFLFSQVKSPSKNPDNHNVSRCFSIFARNLPKTTRFPTVTRRGKGIAFGKKLAYLYSKVLTAIGCAIIPLAGVAIFHFCSAGFSVDQLAKIWALEVMAKVFPARVRSHSLCQYFHTKTRKRTTTSPVTTSTRWIPTSKPSADPNPRNRQAP